MDMRDCKKTDTTLYLLPLLGYSKDVIIDDHPFINAYIDNGSIAVEYEYPLGNDTESPLEIIEFNDAIQIAYQHFIRGHYSRISERHKQTILKFWNAENKSQLYYVLYPSEYLYETTGEVIEGLEIKPKPDLRVELLNP